MEKALAGVRIIDLTRALAGPYGAMILGDLGAEIIKIEAVGSNRMNSGGTAFKGQDAYNMSINRSKKSITLDTRTEKGREIFYDLVKISDVVFDNFRPGVLERLKMDYETLKKINPRIISCSISGFGSSGPYRDRPAYDVVIQALTGVMSITGEPDRPPVRCGVALSDQGAGMFAAHGILAALYARERTGVGQKVETSLFEATIAQIAYEASIYYVSGEIPGPVGSGHRILPVYQAFETRDGYVSIAAVGDKYPLLFKALGREDLLKDTLFTGPATIENKKERVSIIQEVFLTKTTEEWMRLLIEADVPCGPVNTLDKALADPQVAATDMAVTIDHPSGAQVRQTGNPIKMSGTPPELKTKFLFPPYVGEHTEETLSRLLGYSEETLARLREEKII
ncbi:MAG: CoA transferase [Deltaproteobacteria bacterium]|nr:CoA transferase [Deltaproteobacteria bacterium]